MRSSVVIQGLSSGEPLPSSPGVGSGEAGSKARQLVAAALERLEKGLRAGRSQEMQDYLRALARFHRYSFHNCLLIASQFPTATRVAGFQSWRKLGRWVRRGEKGIAIVAPVMARKSDTGDEDGEIVLRFKQAHVFDVSQTEGEALPEPPSAHGDPGQHLEALHHFAGERGIAVERSHDFAPGMDGLSTGGRILLLAGLRPAEELHVLARELAHELLHQDDSGERSSKTVRETEAEAVAFAVSEAVGLQLGAASADYVTLYSGGPETLRASLERIQRTATALLGAVLLDDGT